MNKLKAGYARVNINPMLGIGVAGYFVPRYASGILDDIEAAALALSCGETTFVMLSVDSCGIRRDMSARYRDQIAEATGLSREQIWIAATHTHTGPMNTPSGSFPVDEEKIARYAEFLGQRLADAAVLALKDLRPARMGVITGWAPERVAYIRRYQMKDGSVMTCPPVDDPNIDHPLGELDQRVHVLRLDREGAEGIVLMNYGLHADTINSDMISPDWPGWTRRTLEQVLGVKCICMIGAEGDVGSTNVHPTGGDMNDTEISFDNEMKSPGMARFVGRALAGTVLQVYDKAEFLDVEEISMLHHTVRVAANRPKPDEMPLAKQYKALHDAGRDCEIPYTAMELTTVVAEATRMCRLEHGPDEFFLEMTGVRLGDVAFVGIPGEPFTEIGVRLKETAGWKEVLPCCLVNGSQGYFPSRAAFGEGGYEARCSNFRPEVSDVIVEGGRELLRRLKQS